VGNGGLDVDCIDDDDAVVVAVSTTPLLAIDELEEFRDGGSSRLLSPFDASNYFVLPMLACSCCALN